MQSSATCNYEKKIKMKVSKPLWRTKEILCRKTACFLLSKTEEMEWDRVHFTLNEVEAMILSRGWTRRQCRKEELVTQTN